MKRSEYCEMYAKSRGYANPPVMHGFVYVHRKWYNGYEIERISDGSQFVWIPVGVLVPNGTLDGKIYGHKFGRRDYLNDGFDGNEFFDPLDDVILRQYESIRKYEGFYISKYEISKNPQTGRIQSVKGEYPYTGVDFHDAWHMAKNMVKSNGVTSHLTYGAEYDTRLEWLIESGAVSKFEITSNSTELGNFRNSKQASRRLLKTDSRRVRRINNIYGAIGNTDEWTQECYDAKKRVIRGGHYKCYGYDCPAAFKEIANPSEKFRTTGFRVTLCVE